MKNEEARLSPDVVVQYTPPSFKGFTEPPQHTNPAQDKSPAVNIYATSDKHIDNLIKEKVNTEGIKPKEEFMQYGGYKIYERSDNRWCAKPRVEGERLSVYGRTQKECYEKLKRIIEKKSYSKVKHVKLFEWLETWTKIYKMPKLKPKSFYEIKLCINNHIIPNIKNFELNKLRAIDVEIALSKITSSRMKKYAYDTYRDALRQAYKNKFIKDNISDLIESVVHRREPGRALTIQERDVFLKQCKNINRGDIFLFYFYSGARKTELLELKWEGISDQTVFLPGTKSDNAPRHLPKFNALSEILERQNKNSELVFPMSSVTLKREKEKLENLCGFKFKIKDLRTTFGTMCAENRISDKAVSKWMGHGQVDTTKNYYIRVLDDYEKQQKALFNAAFGAVTKCDFDPNSDPKN